MNIILSIGILISTGYTLGKLAELAKLPKISGYILAGILLNPDLSGIMSKTFVDHTNPLLSISLSLITFSIGGSLSLLKIKKTGKKILLLTLFESLSAFIFVFIFMFLILFFFIHLFDSTNIIIGISLILASLAAPTDPSATLAVIHEYKAKGTVSSAMLEIAAFDDIVGIMIYTLISSFALSLLGDTSMELNQILSKLSQGIGGAILLGFLMGLLFNFIVKIFIKQSEGSLIELTFGLVLLCFGIADYLEIESLLAAMTMGAVVTNMNPMSEKIFKLLERYTDELIFVVFFSLSGLHLQLSSIGGSALLILIYIAARAMGKFSGIFAGSIISKVDPKTKKYAAGGLLPQGGIVIGLALLLTKKPIFDNTASLIIGIVIGAALIHEIFGPLASRLSLKSAGELN